MSKIISSEYIPGENIATFSLNRPLIKDDFNIDVIYPVDEVDLHVVIVVEISLKISILNQLLTSFGIKLSHDYKYRSLSDSISMGGLAKSFKDQDYSHIGMTDDERKVPTPRILSNRIIKNVELLGITTEKFNAEIEVKKEYLDKNANILIDTTIDEANDLLLAFISKKNRKAESFINSIVYELDCTDEYIKKALGNDNFIEINKRRIEEKEIISKIKELKVQVNTLREESYAIKRAAITALFKSEVGPKVNEIIDNVNPDSFIKKSKKRHTF